MKKTASILLFLLASCFAFSQGWERFYGISSGANRAFDALQLPDGDYLVLNSVQGQTTSIIRTDEMGFEKWSKPLNNQFYSTTMFLLPSGNISIFSNDSRMIVIDTAANVLFLNPVSPSFLSTQYMFPVPGGYISIVHSSPGALMMQKIDLNGLLVWDKTVQVSNIFPGGRGAASPDGGFVFVGQTPQDINLVKFDADGNLEWTSTEGTPDIDGYNMIVVATSDGGYAVATDGAGANYSNRIFKFDGSGNLLWWGEHIREAPYASMNQYAQTLIETTDGGFAIAGRLTTGTEEYPTVLKFDATGSVDFFFVSQYMGRFNSVLETSDGSYHAVGQAINEQTGFTTPRAYAAKLNYNGTLFLNFLRGQVALDENEDCFVSASDLLLENWVIRATGTNVYYGTTNADGRYLIGVDTGAFSLEVFPPNDLWLPCENEVMLSLPNVGDTLTIDFPVQAAIECPAMQVDIATPFLRRCFENTLTVQYCNLGTVTAEDATIEVTLDGLMQLVSSSVPVTNQTNNAYTFSIGDVGVNSCGSFQIVASISCDAVLGQTLCMEAHVFPDTICGIPFNWSGASMVARAKCQGDSTVILELENVGNAPTSEALDYIVIEDQIIFLQDSEVFDPMEVATFLQLANGSTWRIISEQEPNHPGNAIPTAFVEGCGTNEVHTFSTGFVNEHPLADGDGFIDIDCNEVVGAYDPNDKMGFPIGYSDQHYIEPNTDIEYRIRFQNTGTDTAFTVVIRDTLSPNLDPATLRAGAASHNYEFDLEGNAVAIFRFNNIQLPDSNTNEALSHGFVSFRISQKPDVALGSVIENEAAIYFDFNDPVITNQVFHTVNRNFIEILSDTEDLPEGLGALLAYPNPSAGEVTFEIPSEQPVKATFALYDQLGQLVLRKGFTEQHFRFNGTELSKGVYFYKIEVEGLGMYSGKVILK